MLDATVLLALIESMRAAVHWALAPALKPIGTSHFALRLRMNQPGAAPSSVGYGVLMPASCPLFCPPLPRRQAVVRVQATVGDAASSSPARLSVGRGSGFLPMQLPRLSGIRLLPVGS